MHLTYPVPFFDRVFENALWFAGGAFIVPYWENAKHIVRRAGSGIWALAPLGIGWFLALGSLGIPTRSNIISTFVCGTILLAISIMLAAQKNCIERFVLTASKYSYGIYLLSPWPQAGVRVLLFSALGVPYFFSVVLQFVLGFLFPYLVLIVVERTSLSKSTLLRLIVGLRVL